ncbi:TPA: efflux RND transporter periplasmic adaptor subunit [Pseudomonas putida]|uniref:efflux RND transporter periplasmic adaptor subunit n=1 Tax=Pseudomonas putida TaxID=303 RepID=UPI00110CF195|nr:efflux RND transporter periplasmic adaptor subunit [Pseudomonas putida]MDD1991181.1 efflux RND transporter periplasmic adaptor subunit [Pseudomonas putida]HDS0918335.1 efflux RND transporter periplasmic adaptor subunit [Pseudomonas putida]HDS0921572.1 efflux RND transporter periplasmic adaptor subunit [Pseudomonas putida]HDS0931916.1 efflux RND transporter periplasmic adaptor subunit [Pseudomonas putida]HDS0936804.1 efflux RND transporter periplasmic adaptor subunit [Pseudomonas putida]
MPTTLPPRLRPLALMAFLSLSLAGCGDSAEQDEKAPTPQVRVETLQLQPLVISSELSGRILAPRTAEVRARVEGVVLKRVYREGSDVKQGDVLFLIDPSPFKADHDSARATLAKAEATLYQARLQEQRYRELVDDKAVSRQEYDNAKASFLQADAEVAAAKAALERARLNLGYATVTAPISGRIGRAQVTEGALVGQNETTPLATIQQLDPIHADVTQSTRELNALRRALRAGELQQVGDGQARATLIQDDGSAYPLPGKLLFSDISVDPTTNQITLRSEFPNPDLDLLPGSYVRVRLEQAVQPKGLSVPQRAILRDSAGVPKVLVVDQQARVSDRQVVLGSAQGDRWVVSEGLAPGERVVVEGLQHVKAGDQVQVDNASGAPPIAQHTGQ